MTDATAQPSAFLQHQPVARRLSVRAFVAIAASGLLGLFWFHRADLTSGLRLMSGDAGDTRLIAFLLEHQWQALLGHAAWPSPPMFYPQPGTLGYADAFVLQGLLYWPLRALGSDVFTALQVSTLLLNALNYAVMAWLLHRVLRLGVLPTIAGALLFAFNSAKFNQFVHLQLQPLLLLPLMVALCVDLARRMETLPPRGVFLRLAGVALLLDLQLLSGVYVAWFFGFYGLLYLGLLLLLAPTRVWLARHVVRHVAAIAAAAGVFLVGAIPFAVLYVPVLRDAGWRSYGDAQGMIPSWYSVLLLGDRNWLWAWLEKRVPHFYELPFFWEHRIGLGAVVTLAWLALTFAVLRAVRPWPVRAARAAPTSAHFLAVLVLAVTAFYLLGMKYAGHSPWWFAFHTVPGIKSIRAVSRYVIVLALPMAIALAWALDALLTRVRMPGRVALAALVTLAALEQVGTRDGYDKAQAAARIQTLAARLPQGCAAFYVTAPQVDPVLNVSRHIDAMLVAQRTGVPTLNGYSGQAPKDWSGVFQIGDPAYEQHVAAWVQARGVRGRICALPDGN